MSNADTGDRAEARPRFNPEVERGIWQGVCHRILLNDDTELVKALDRYARREARRICSRLAHRNGRCRCDLGNPDGSDRRAASSISAFAPGYNEIMDGWLGHSAGRGRQSGIERWLSQGATEPFVAYDRKNSGGRETDVNRAWNRDRGQLAQDINRDKLVGNGPRAADRCESLSRAIAAIDADEHWNTLSEEWPHALTKGIPTWVPPVQDPVRWAEALARDACQPAEQAIDTDRVARKLFWRKSDDPPPGPTLLDACAVLAPLVDEAIQEAIPDLHDRWIGSRRMQTRLASGDLDQFRFSIVDRENSDLLADGDHLW